jgi:transcriptional regulator with XRE-family HTH domain
MKTLGERIKYIQRNSGKNQTIFAQSLGVSKGSVILYQKNERSPDSSFLKTLCELYKVNPSWLLLGEGEPFIADQGQAGRREGTVGTIDPVVLLLNEEEKRAGIVLTPEQRTAVLKILREFVYRDMRSIRELMQSMQEGPKEEGA